MRRADLAKRVERANCKVYGWQEASNDGHRAVVGALLEAFDNSESALLVESSLSRNTNRPPDVVLIDAEIGVAVVEVKAVSLAQIEAVEPGGVLVIRYASGVRRRNAIAKVRTEMFDIKDATERAYAGGLTLPFRYWVTFPSIHRATWQARFGRDGFCPTEILFREDLERVSVLRRSGVTGRSADTSSSICICDLEQSQCVWSAFGDDSVLYLRSDA